MTGKLALLFAGQGAQHPRMFDIVHGHAAAEATLAEAAGLLGGRHPRAAAADDEARFGNRTGQILCCAAVAAAWSALALDRTQPMVLAGYSIGELAAWHCAGMLDAGTLLRLAAERAELMDKASVGQDGRLLAVVGLGRANITPLCEAYGADIAIINGPQHFVLGVPVARVDALMQALTAARPTVLRLLPVAVASHTSAIQAASAKFLQALQTTPMAASPAPNMRLLSGVDGEPVLSAARGQVLLAEALSHRIDWAACLDTCRESGVSTVLELGPGNSLATMAREAIPGARVHSIDDFRELEGVARWLAG